MRALALAGVLFAVAVAAANPGLRNTGARIDRRCQRDPCIPAPTPLLNIMPDGGTGPAGATLCQAAADAGFLTGTYFCLSGDGTHTTSGMALTANGTPVSASRKICPKDLDCTAADSVHLNGSTQSWKTATTSIPSGDFSACSLVMKEDASSGQLISKEVTSHNVFFSSIQNDQTVFFRVTNSGATTSDVNPVTTLSLRAWHLVCTTYDEAGAGTSVMRSYLDGTEIGNKTNAVSINNDSTTFIGVGQRQTNAQFHLGGTRGAFFLDGQLLSAANITTLASRVLPYQNILGTNNEAITFTRTTTTSCPPADFSATTIQKLNVGCTRNGAIPIEEQPTHAILRSEEFSSATWVKTGTVVASPVVTADTTDVLAPDGSQTAEKVVLPAVANAGEASTLTQTVTMSATSWSQGVWLRTASGTASVYLYSSAAGAQPATAQTLCAVTTTWSRCKVEGFTATAASWTVGIGTDLTTGSTQAATGVQTIYAWGADAMAKPALLAYARTVGSTVGISSTMATTANPVLITDTNWCMALTASSLSWTGSWSTTQRGLMMFGTTYPNGNTTALFVDGSAHLVAEAYDVTGTPRGFTGTSTVSAGAHRFRLCAVGGQMLTSIDGTSEPMTPSGAGSPRTTMPSTMTLGSLGNTHFLNGELKNVCFSRGIGGCT